jgi:hypothetical protein
MENNPSPATGRIPFPPQAAAPARPRVWKSRWFGVLTTICSVLLIAVVCVEITRRANTYGKQVVESHPVDARIEIVNPPAYLDRQIINSLLDEAYAFAQKDETHYNRIRNVLDGGVLRDIADLYTGTETLDGKTSPRQAVGYNAWISKITEVRREVAKDKSIQAIQIYAQWRQPQAWVRVNDQLYLVDPEGTRLPGDYQLNDRPRSRLLVITGVDLPAIEAGGSGGGGGGAVPRAGEKWAAGKNGTLADDMLAAFALVERLKKQPFASQIDAVDMTNFNGRKAPLASWITLQTIWPAADGTPRVVQWGRPVGEEKYYEVQADVKLKTLNEIYQRFSRIDAGRDYVDIRTEMVRLAKLPTPPGQ